LPAIILYSTSAAEKTSERGLGRPSACSGAMYPSVPEPDASTLRMDTFASPKSARRTRPSPKSRMFSGFTSQWMMRRLCA
jgi:hypothetical protein